MACPPVAVGQLVPRQARHVRWVRVREKPGALKWAEDENMPDQQILTIGFAVAALVVLGFYLAHRRKRKLRSSNWKSNI